MKDYRPILSHSFISKLMESMVARLVEEHFEHKDLHKDYRYVYRRGHSAETALPKMRTDIAEALDEGSTNA